MAQYGMDSEKKYSLAIVGGGIGGLCTAIGLLKQGVDVHIYEAAPQFSEIGAGVSLGPNAARALKMIDPALYAGYEKTRTNNAWLEKQHHWFTFRIGDDASKTLPETHLLDLHCETGQSSVHRARFLDELVGLVPEHIAHFGKKLLSIDERPSSITLHFTDGTTATHSAAIGCDGVKSITRPLVLGKSSPASAPTFTGKYAYRGLIPMSTAAAILGDELARNAQQYLGHGAHVLTYPISNGAILNVVAFGTKADGRWEGEWVKPMDREGMMREFEGWIEPVQKILGLMERSEVWALFDHPNAESYVSEGGRICLLGDAAHASTPHNGAGAGQAVEDALILSRFMGCVREERDIEKAFRAYDVVRRPRSQMQVEKARFAGLVYDMQAPGTGDDLGKMREQLSDRRWLWEHDLEADVREVERLFCEGRKENGVKV
ncbi:hypothetical protein M409DRAFT_20099 [Zasmidium cellare ATCC 36951]|uniref:FAD-binding domain-containing protein n=1 Tax=Zasmidium cellare ATCC 36951 TaxID=1080233 RepID=A0A6A6CR99_ZASCE|nr:uncharacterized protein M409DRAFT_20099 [Zasmidium cellare ATCC 36951]KAF2169684.1 hypothetical protein M409DRAFT_20099 [Zasmidium cellare ATCC 36951]